MEGIIKPYFYAACGGVGFALSFIVGLFSGAGFALILTRALAFAVLFALLSCCLHLVLRRFLPELVEEAVAMSKVESKPSKRSLNITIDDDDSLVPDFLQDIAADGVDWQVGGDGEGARAKGLDADGMLDELPDMPEASGLASMPSNLDNSVYSDPLDPSGLFDDIGADTMAKAIRTVLSKE